MDIRCDSLGSEDGKKKQGPPDSQVGPGIQDGSECTLDHNSKGQQSMETNNQRPKFLVKELNVKNSASVGVEE